MEVSTVERWLEVNLAYSADDDDENEGDFWTNNERDLTTFQNDNFWCYKLFGFILADNTLPVNRDCLFICVFQDWLFYHNIIGCLNNLIRSQFYSQPNLPKIWSLTCFQIDFLTSSRFISLYIYKFTLYKLNTFTKVRLWSCLISVILHWFKWTAINGNLISTSIIITNSIAF
jgi:hypothetical protein